MIFGKIDYLNLLPFHVFMKRYAKSSRHHLIMHYKRGVPTKINADFAMRRVDAAFISSIAARGRRHAGIGIVARREVLSVMVIPSDTAINDSESATSNLLAQLLGIHGQVLIGDKALRYHLSGDDYTDLAGEWRKRFGLPFVFALLCSHSRHRDMQQLARAFTRRPVKIPYYLLREAAIKSGVHANDILHYLTHISYTLDPKAYKALNKFWSLSRVHPDVKPRSDKSV